MQASVTIIHLTTDLSVDCIPQVWKCNARTLRDEEAKKFLVFILLLCSSVMRIYYQNFLDLQLKF